VRRLAYGGIALFLILSTPLYAQNPAPDDLKAKIDELKGKIFDAHMAQQTFAEGLQHCNELNGKSFFYQLRRRILNLEDYLQSLENLAKAQAFNPEKRRPWTLEDVKQRWEEVKKQAQEDKQRCELVQSLPDLEKRLQELQQSAAAGAKPEQKE
jgi:hypothetical protein